MREGSKRAEPGHDRAIAVVQGGSKDFSRQVDELQQRVAATKAVAQAAATESREQLRQRDVAGIVITSDQDGRFRTYPPRRHRSEGVGLHQRAEGLPVRHAVQVVWLIATARLMRSSQDEGDR